MSGFNVRNFGAAGDGYQDDTQAIQQCIDAACAAGSFVYLPPGRYRLTALVGVTELENQLVIRGDGPSISVLCPHGCSALYATFKQVGGRQPYGLDLRDVGFEAIGPCHTAVRVSYDTPTSTIDHRHSSVIIHNVLILSGNNGAWYHGLDIADAWNCDVSNVYISGGDPEFRDGQLNWNTLAGDGIVLRRHVVNSHFTNVRVNQFRTGIFYESGPSGNTEGLFFTNCSLVAVCRGVWIVGDANAPAPRMSTLNWTGGMIECRVGGVSTGSAAFHLVNVWTALIVGCQFITEEIPDTHITYALFLDNCSGIVVCACDLNAWHYGVYTVGMCRAINVNSNTQTNLGTTVCFNGGTSRSRVYGNVAFNGQVYVEDHGTPGHNKVGFVS